MSIQREDDPTVPYGPGGVCARGDMMRIPIDHLLACQLFRFRGPLLSEEGGQQHTDPHLQEFALPILGDGLLEMARPQILAVSDGGLSVPLLLLMLLAMAGQALPHECQDK
jgi:hypothetical protein